MLKRSINIAYSTQVFILNVCVYMCTYTALTHSEEGMVGILGKSVVFGCVDPLVTG